MMRMVLVYFLYDSKKAENLFNLFEQIQREKEKSRFVIFISLKSFNPASGEITEQLNFT